MAEEQHLQWVAGASWGGKFEYLFTSRVVPGSKATLLDTGGSGWNGVELRFSPMGVLRLMRDNRLLLPYRPRRRDQDSREQ